MAHVRTMDQVVIESTARNEFNMTLLSIFAGIALLLAAIGIYGLMAYTVQQRTQEIGIRMALGAQPGDVLRMVLRHGLLLCLVGNRRRHIGRLRSHPPDEKPDFRSQPDRPGDICKRCSFTGGVAFAACWIPARRASRVDPMVALRHE